MRYEVLNPMINPTVANNASEQMVCSVENLNKMRERKPTKAKTVFGGMNDEE